MVPRFSAHAARDSRPRMARAVLSLTVGCLALASAGCFLHSAAKPLPPTQQQVAAFAEQQTALRDNASVPKEEPQQHCDQLAMAMPGVEELRTNHGSIESRQWTLLANGSAPRWAFVRANDGAANGWAPKPGLDKLGFQPPLEPALNYASSVFLAYAPVQSESLEDSQKSATVREVFGPAQGDFTWRGR